MDRSIVWSGRTDTAPTAPVRYGRTDARTDEWTDGGRTDIFICLRVECIHPSYKDVSSRPARARVWVGSVRAPASAALSASPASRFSRPAHGPRGLRRTLGVFAPAPDAVITDSRAHQLLIQPCEPTASLGSER
eukprot:576881-Prymnesium_polylepis.1